MTSTYLQYYLYTHVEFTIITEDSNESVKYRNPCSTSFISVLYTLCTRRKDNQYRNVPRE